MSVFKGLIGSLLAILGCFMVTIFLIRLSTGHDAFIGVSDMVSFFETVDFLQPFKEMISDMTDKIGSFNDSIANFGNINSFGDFWYAMGQFFPNLFNIIGFPVELLYYIGYFIYNIIMILVRFFDFACGFNLLQ